MKKGHWAGLYVAGVLTVVCLYGPRFIFASSQSGPPDSLLLPDEQKHLKNVRQLTFGGQNAEAYFSIDDKQLIFQHQGADVPCRPDLHHRSRLTGRQTARPEARQHRQGPHNVQLLLSLRRPDSVFLHSRHQRRLSVQAGLFPWLRLAHL